MVSLVDKYLPDPYLFVIILTLLSFIAAMVFEGHGPMAVVEMWGNGFWNLLTFSMQMLLVLVTGFMMASTPLVRGILNRIAGLARTPGQAIVLVTFVALIASWINWGFGLVVGALFAKALARQIRVHYPLLIASAYSGFIVWHGGLAGIVIQFPFYAGIMSVMTASGLAASISSGFVSMASAESLPFWSFISAGLVNIFVPSGGGQWAVQAPVMLPAAQELGADIPRVAMAVAWGDAWTNLLQPFWALPVLAIAGLKAKDIMGYCLMLLIITGIVISAGLTWL
jgi:short subunit fatty acids transporter